MPYLSLQILNCKRSKLVMQFWAYYLCPRRSWNLTVSLKSKNGPSREVPWHTWTPNRAIKYFWVLYFVLEYSLCTVQVAATDPVENWDGQFWQAVINISRPLARTCQNTELEPVYGFSNEQCVWMCWSCILMCSMYVMQNTYASTWEMSLNFTALDPYIKNNFYKAVRCKTYVFCIEL